MRRPRLSRRILQGIVEMGALASAGDESDLCGDDSDTSKRAYDDAMKAYDWARDMIDWMEQRPVKKRSHHVKPE